MHMLTHYRLCPRSRALRLAINELGIDTRMIEQEPWTIGPQFLALNPAGELPVLQLDTGPVLCGVFSAADYICSARDNHDTIVPAGQESSDKPPQLSLFLATSEDRAEVWRLVDLIHNKLNRDVTTEMLHEKVYARMQPELSGGPDAGILRIARNNLRVHLRYIDFLSEQRDWLAGDMISFADLSAAAHISCLDYVGEIDWATVPHAKSWYQRLKSRPSFRPLLADRIAGMPPPPIYTDLDF